MKNFILMSLLILPINQVFGQSDNEKRSIVEVLRVGQIVSVKSDSLIIEAESETQSSKFGQKWTDVYKVTEIGKDFVALQNHEYDRYLHSSKIRQIIRKRSLRKTDELTQKKNEWIAKDKARQEQVSLMQSVAKDMVELQMTEKSLIELELNIIQLQQGIKILKEALAKDDPQFVFNGKTYTEVQIAKDLNHRTRDLEKRHADVKKLELIQKKLRSSIESKEAKLKELTLPEVSKQKSKDKRDKEFDVFGN